MFNIWPFAEQDWKVNSITPFDTLEGERGRAQVRNVWSYAQLMIKRV